MGMSLPIQRRAHHTRGIVNGFARSAGQQHNNNNGKSSSAGWTKGKEADAVGEVSEGCW